MIINGQKWSCETCIKGHRASSCEHRHRELIPIKKKGRPATQCVKCRELRLVRQLHRKCDCETATKEVEKHWINEATVTKKRIKPESLRLLAPKQDMAKELQSILNTLDFDHPAYLPLTENATYPLHPPMAPKPFLDIHHSAPKQSSTCCKGLEKKPQNDFKSQTQRPPTNKPSGGCCPPSDKPSGGCCPTTAPASCLGPPAKNQQGETIRLVTCRCGDDCACIGCDAHPSRAMKEGKNDVYIGFSEPKDTSIHWLSKIEKASDSLCGCSKQSENCTNCLLKLCYPDYA
ncbi:copper fist DNA binding domain-containing protein [Sporodiniella umbellata]|nr:copper fist DNA binding domain-containing protein [Sporodiniella umbellata]